MSIVTTSDHMPYEHTGAADGGAINDTKGRKCIATCLMNIQVLQMVVPSMTHRGRECIAIYFPRVRVVLSDFFSSHKDRDVKKAIRKLGGSTNLRRRFLRITSTDTEITFQNGITRGSITFIPRYQVPFDLLERTDRCK